MRALRYIIALTSICFSVYYCCARSIALETDVVSPNGRVVISLDTTERTTFSVRRDGRQLIGPSQVGYVLEGGTELGTSVTVIDESRGTLDETFQPAWGKAKPVANHCKFAELTLREKSGVAWQIELRAYDEGVAFRYRIPAQTSLPTVSIHDESTAFDLAGHPSVLFNTLDSFTTSHESLYQQLPASDIPVGALIDCPLLVEWADGPAAAITEARVLEFSGMYLRRESPQLLQLRCRLAPLAPLPARPMLSVVDVPPLQSPWRVVLLADVAGELSESNLLLCLNDPPQLDFGWVVPGKTTFHWWNGEFENDYKSTSGNNAFVARHKTYIDFCAENGIAYHGLSGDGRAWYPQSSTSYGTPSADADVRMARPELRLPEILEYAKQRGVGIRLWVHWKPLSVQLEEAFSNYESWGVKGLMVDF